jgi:hypothetical protein
MQIESADRGANDHTQSAWLSFRLSKGAEKKEAGRYPARRNACAAVSKFGRLMV